MKKLIVILAGALLFAACNNASDTQTTTDSSVNTNATTIQADTNSVHQDTPLDTGGTHRDTIPGGNK